MLQAVSDVIKAAIDSWTQLEVFYYWVKMRSLLAGLGEVSVGGVAARANGGMRRGRLLRAVVA